MTGGGGDGGGSGGGLGHCSIKRKAVGMQTGMDHPCHMLMHAMQGAMCAASRH